MGQHHRDRKRNAIRRYDDKNGDELSFMNNKNQSKTKAKTKTNNYCCCLSLLNPPIFIEMKKKTKLKQWIRFGRVI